MKQFKKFETTLLIDADDTLWDNNIFYENSLRSFSALLGEKGFDLNVLEKQLRTRESENVKFHGYGSRSFAASLLEVYEEACSAAECELDPEVLAAIDEARNSTRNYKITFLKGVVETLPYLSKRFKMILFTKGDREEQLGKVERSGIMNFFDDVIVVSEKNREVYEQVLKDHNLRAEHTWMIGNSPRSDINPARAAGMKTVYIPYHMPWVHESAQIDKDGFETVTLNHFGELQLIFSDKSTRVL